MSTNYSDSIVRFSKAMDIYAIDVEKLSNWNLESIQINLQA